MIAVVLLLAIVGGGVYLLRQERDPLWAAFPAIIVVGPALFVSLLHPPYLHIRYFLVCFPFLYLLVARIVIRKLGMGWTWQSALMAGLLGMAFAVHTTRIVHLIGVHRGSYRRAVPDIWQASGPGESRIASDNDDRNQLLVTFYSPPPTSEKRLSYVRQQDPSASRAEWFVSHSQQVSSTHPPEVLERGDGAAYTLFREYASDGLSGWRWAVYRRRVP